MVEDLFHSIETFAILKIVLVAGFWSVRIRSWEGVSGGDFIVKSYILGSHAFIEIVCLISNGRKHIFVIGTTENPHLRVLQVFQRCDRLLFLIFFGAGDEDFFLDEVNILGRSTVCSAIVVHTAKWSAGGNANTLK